MTLRELLDEEMDRLIGLIPQYRVEAMRSATRFQQKNDLESFQEMLEAQWQVRVVEDRLDFVMRLLDEANE
jgi:hypothetical protein